MIKRRRLLLAGSMLLPAPWLTACGGAGEVLGRRVRLVNASRAYPALDMWIDDDREVSDVAYGSASDYEDEREGTVDLAVTRPGSSSKLLEESFSLESDQPHSLIAYGNEGELALALLVEDEDEDGIDNDQALLQLFNVAPDAGELDLYLTTEDADLADENALITGASYGTLPEAFTEVDKGSYRLRLTAAGVKNDLRLDISGLEIREGKAYTVLASGSEGGVLVDALLLEQDDDVSLLANTLARVRVVAAVADNAKVSVSAGDEVLAAAMTAPTVGVYGAVAAGSRALSITVNGVAVAEVPALDADSGDDWTILVYGTPAAPLVSLLHDDNRVATTETKAKFRLVHAVAGLDAGLTLRVNATTLAANVGFGEASDPAELTPPAVTSNLQVTTPTVVEPLFSIEDVAIEAGKVYTVFMMGSADKLKGQLESDRPE